MVYVFKKINNFTGSTPASSDSSAVISSSDSGSSMSNPHQSTYQNPSNIYNANIGENLGKLDNGIGKSISDTQQNLTDSSGKYKGALDSIDSGYQFNGRSDLENINDPGTFSRLNSMVSPVGEQTQLNAEQSNTRNYNPDTQGLAASSTISGLSNQLKNQYGTTAGGARLDAQLYRGSGQAGKAINENLGQLGDFRADKEKRLGEETNLLSQYNKGAADRSTDLVNQAGAYQGELKSNAETQAKQMQSQFDTQRQNAINSMTATRDNTDYKTQLQNAIDSAFGDRKITQAANNYNSTNGNNTAADLSWLTPEQQQEINTNSPSVKLSNGQSTRMYDFTPYLKQNLLNDFSKQVDLSGFDPSKYVGAQQKFNSDSYLDPRYNQISKLIGGPQVAGTTTPDGQIHADTQGYQDAINNYLSQQTSQAQQAVQGLFNPAAPQNGSAGNPYSQIAKGYAINPVFGQAMMGNELFKNAGSYIGEAGGLLGGLF